MGAAVGARLLLAAILLSALALAITPFTGDGYQAHVDLDVRNHTIYAKVYYDNISIYRKPAASDVPATPSEFFVPPAAGSPSANTEFSATTLPLENASLYFTFNGNEIAGGACSPAPNTNAKGETECLVDSFINSTGETKSIDSEKSCGVVRAEFRGMSVDAKDYSPAGGSASLCPKDSYALSVFGSELSASMGRNVGICFPVILIGALLIASMYYSGRDPLSLFDLTTPRLPRTKPFRGKMSTGPQMIRSVVRRYMMIRNQAEKSAAKGAGMAATFKVREANGSLREQRIAKKQAEAEVRKIFQDLNKTLKDADKDKRGLSDDELKRLTARLTDAFDSRKPAGKEDGKWNRKWGKYRDGATNFIDLYNAAYQAQKAMSAARNPAPGHALTDWLSNKIDSATEGMVKFESTKGARFLNRIPLVGTLARQPGHVLDTFAQWRGSRIGGVRVRRRVMGGIVMAALGDEETGRRKAVKKIFDKTPVGKFFEGLYGWNWQKFEDTHDMDKRVFKSFVNPLENARLNMIQELNEAYSSLARQMRSTLPTRENAMGAVLNLMDQLEAMRRLETDPVRAKQLSELIDRANALGLRLKDMDSGKKTDTQYAALGRKAEEDYKGLYKDIHNSINVRGDREISLDGWRKYEFNKDEKLSKQEAYLVLSGIMRVEVGADRKEKPVFFELQHEHLKALWDLAQGAKLTLTKMNRAIMDIFSPSALSDFKDFEARVVRKWLAVQFSEGQYKAVDWDTLRHARLQMVKEGKVGAAAEADMQKKFGDFAGMTKEQFEQEKQKGLGSLMDAMRATIQAKDAKTKTDYNMLSKMMEEVNKNVGAALGGRSDPGAILRLNAIGTNPSGEYLTRRLRELGVLKADEKIADLNDFELKFFRIAAQDAQSKRRSDDNLRQNIADCMANPDFVRRLGLNPAKAKPEDVAKLLLCETYTFLERWNAQASKSADLAFGSLKKRDDALADVGGESAAKRIKGWVKPHEQLEYAAQRAKFGYAIMDRDLETLLDSSRAYERAMAFTVWGARQGSPQGATAMWLLKATKDAELQSLQILEKTYKNLLDKESAFFHQKFADEVRDKLGTAGSSSFGMKEYQLLMARGFKFTDYSRRGMGYLLTNDGRGVVPLIEYREKVLKDHGYSPDGIVKGSGQRDLSYLLASLKTSDYGNLPVGVVTLIKHTGKKEVAWISGDPYKNKEISFLSQQTAYTVKNQRDSIAAQMAGYTGDAYNSAQQLVKVFSQKDLLDERKGKAPIRHAMSAGTGKVVEALYSGFDAISREQDKWYAAQFQMRLALDAYSRHLENYTTMGGDRLSAKAINPDSERMLDNLASHRMLQEKKIGQEVYDNRKELVERMMHGGATAEETRGAMWANLKRMVLARTDSSIAAAESKLYGAELELKAIKLQRKEGKFGIPAADYDAQVREVQNSIRDYKTELREAKHDFDVFRRSAIDWAGSHNTEYGSRKNIFTATLGHLLGSGQEQGMQMGFYWITESSAMRDPRTDIADPYGFASTFKTGYQTGQTTYEPPRLYMTNTLWEENYRLPMIFSRWVHIGFNPMLSQTTREKGYSPSYLEMDALYPGEFGKVSRYSSMLLMPIRRHYSTDYFQTVGQSLLDWTGISSVAAAYQTTGKPLESGERITESNLMRRALDHVFVPSGHYATHGRAVFAQRLLDQFEQFDVILGKYKDANEAYEKYLATPEGSEDQKEAMRDLKKYLKIIDRRPEGVQKAFGGSDMDNDGSRNRFMNLYVGFHENIWKPISPGLHDIDPRTGASQPFPQVSAIIDRSPEGSRLDNLKNFSITTYDADKDKPGSDPFSSRDQFTTHQDSFKEAYRRDSNALLQLLKTDHERILYSPLNTPSIMFWNPFYGGLVYYGFRNLAASTEAGAYSTVGSTGEFSHGVKHEWDNPLESWFPSKPRQPGQAPPPGKIARYAQDVKENFTTYMPVYSHRRKRGDFESNIYNAVQLKSLTKRFTKKPGSPPGEASQPEAGEEPE